MKYTERIGDTETTYEGTPQEIMNLYNNFKKMNEEDNKAKEHYVNFKHFKLTPSGACELDFDKIGNELAKRELLALSQI